MEAETLNRIADLADRLAEKKFLDKHASAAEICDTINAGLGLMIHHNSTAGRYAEACFRRRIEHEEVIAELETQFTEVSVVDRCNDYGSRAA